MADGEFPDADRDARYYWPFGESDGWTSPAVDLPPSAPPPPARRPPRWGAVIATAAATALLIGGMAGYGGARLAQPNPVAAPVPAPAAPLPSSAPPPPPPVRAGSAVEVARQLVPSTVMIKVGSATGSGFVLDRSGHVMTNNHVVAKAATGDPLTVVFSDGRRIKARLVGRSPSYDLAVIKVAASTGLQPVRIGDSDRIRVGEQVIAVGSPLGLPGTVTQGIVSAVNRPLVVDESRTADAPSAYIDGIQTDAPINPGNSGGPLVDATARVIGVNSAILTVGSPLGQAGNIGLGFAIPSNQAQVIGKMLIDKGRATYPVIGAGVRNARSGVELTSLEDGGPARRAGLRTGDVVRGVDGALVTRTEELIVLIRARRPGDAVQLSYTRGSVRRTARVVLEGKEG